MFGIGEATDNYEHLDAEPYDEVARSLEKQFGFSAVAITLRENPLVWLNSWSAIVAAEAISTARRAMRSRLWIALAPGTRSAAG